MRSFNNIITIMVFSMAKLIAKINPVDDGDGLLIMDWHSLYNRMVYKI